MPYKDIEWLIIDPHQKKSENTYHDKRNAPAERQGRCGNERSNSNTDQRDDDIRQTDALEEL